MRHIAAELKRERFTIYRKPPRGCDLYPAEASVEVGGDIRFDMMAGDRMSEKPSLLVLQRILPPYRLSFFQALANSPHVDLTVAYGDAAHGTGLTSVDDAPGIQTLHLSNWRPFRSERFIYQHGWRNLLKRRRFDVVIAEFNPRIFSSLILCALSRLWGPRFIWWGHGLGHRVQGRFWRIILRRMLIDLADAVIFYDGAQSEHFGQFGVPEAKRFVAANAVDTERIMSLARPAGSIDGRYRITYIGRLVSRKKVALLLRAFAIAIPKLPARVTLTVIGDGPERITLEQLARRLAIAHRTEFRGSVLDEAALAPLFNTSLASVSPGAIGLSAVHSAAYGVPLLVSRDEPHGPELSLAVEGQNARYFASNNEQELAQMLIALNSDEISWCRMSVRAREIASIQGGIGAMVDTFERAVSCVLNH